MKVILSGGGTAGSVMPLLAIYSEIKKQRGDTEFLFIGTRKGEPEKKILSSYHIPFRPIFGGKLRRYFDLRNISDILLILIGFIQSIYIILKFRPDVVMGAGGFISVPVIWAAWVLQKKIIIHQQDIKPSLSNILTMNLAHKITVTFERSLRNFPAGKTIWTGNPVRSDIIEGNRQRAYERFALKPDIPLVLIMGGGTGALSVNTIVNQALPELIKFCQIIHLTGVGKKVTGIASEQYQQFEFLEEEMKDVLVAADLVVSRAGLSVLTEFSILGKPVILIPLPKSHQEENAEYFSEKGAAKVIHQKNLSPRILVSKVKELLNDKAALNILSSKIGKMTKPQATAMIVEQIFNLVKQ